MIREQARNSSGSRDRAMDQRLVEVSKYMTWGVGTEKVKFGPLTSVY